MTSHAPTFAELLWSVPLSDSVRSLTWRALADPPLSWRPGQYVELSDLEGTKGPFAYSIASAPDPAKPGIFELCVGSSPEAACFEALEPGGRAQISEPQGEFVRDPQRRAPALFIGSGTGIAPLRAMIQAHFRAPPTTGVALTLLFGCRTEKDALYADGFFELATKRPEFRFVPTLSRNDGVPPSHVVNASVTSQRAPRSFRMGRVQLHVRELVEQLGEPEIYVCGPTPMVEDVRRTLDGLAVEGSRVFFEGL